MESESAAPDVPAPAADANGGDTEPDMDNSIPGGKISKSNLELCQLAIVKTVLQFKNAQIFQ
jgi:hypothetical protein